MWDRAELDRQLLKFFAIFVGGMVLFGLVYLADKAYLCSRAHGQISENPEAFERYPYACIDANGKKIF